MGEADPTIIVILILFVALTMDVRYVFLYFVTRILTVNSATHSLIYICTALSKDLGLPGAHKFTAISLLDGKPFDRFDTDTPRKIPTTNWARQHLTTDYLDKGTQRLLDKQEWFGVTLDLMMTQMGHSVSEGDLHVLQWLHGCYGETNPTEERLRFVGGVNTYAYDGATVLKEYDSQYLRGECIDWLTRFVGYSTQELRERATVPDMYVFTRKASATTLTLICLASGFSTNTSAMRLMRNGRVLDTDDGLKVFDTLPNDDDTFQRRIAVDILPSDMGNFTCEVLEEVTGYHVVKHWRVGDRQTLPLCLVVACIVQKRRTGQNGGYYTRATSGLWRV
uniref:Ig-like domain-containing protein n=1 Tax=Neolamprologus brichardi TaxID=32507 RepID=A0A3Q4GGB4_NEOBR